MVKRSMAVLVVLTGVILHRVLLSLKLRRRRCGRAGSLSGLGSLDGGQPGGLAAWAGGFLIDHGDRTIDLTADWPQQAGPGWTGNSIASRLSTDGHCFRRRHHRLVCVERLACITLVLAGADPGGLALLGYNLWFFGSIVGGQARIEQFHIVLHGVSGIWSRNLRRRILRDSFQPKSRTLCF